MREVALVSMPFGPLFSPSIGLSLLKAALARGACVASEKYQDRCLVGLQSEKAFGAKQPGSQQDNANAQSGRIRVCGTCRYASRAHTHSSAIQPLTAFASNSIAMYCSLMFVNVSRSCVANACDIS